MKRAEHKDFWELQVSRLAIVNPKLFNGCRAEAHHLKNAKVSSVRSILALLALGLVDSARHSRYLARAFRRVTEAPTITGWEQIEARVAAK